MTHYCLAIYFHIFPFKFYSSPGVFTKHYTKMESLEPEISGILVRYFITKEDKGLGIVTVLWWEGVLIILYHLVFVIHVAAVAQGVSQSSTDQTCQSQVQINGEGYVRKGTRCKKNHICRTSRLFRWSTVATRTGSSQRKKIIYVISILV